MAIMRNTLLWASQNDFLKKHVPRRKFVQRAVRRFMPGEQIEDALVAANRLSDRGITTTLTALGENITDIAEADAELEHYLGVYKNIERTGTDTEISVKLTHLGLDIDPRRTAEIVDALATRANEADGWLWIDMEASEYVEPTLDLYRRALENHDNVGICLQAYLHRTPKDIEELTPLKAGVRLVKGAYKEPSAIAVNTKSEIDARFLEVGKMLLDRTADMRVALGSHDVDLLDQLTAYAAGRAIGKDQYEIQMLYGIRVPDQHRYAADGYQMRTLIGYGDGWYPWYMRRLAERPANLGFVFRSIFSRSK
ncbi:MAG: proline dehydrogenase family protein [Acidimicrobiia bacterium]|nr:proline dehydrogenase family protein [Acidimicrobiia bacterium]